MTKLFQSSYVLLTCLLAFLSTSLSAQTGTTPCDGDTLKPFFERCPRPIVLTTNDTCAVAQWDAPVAFDNCGIRSLVGSHQSGTCFKIGTTDVAFYATDSAGNTSSCRFSVTVKRLATDSCATDTIKPHFTFCPTNIVLTTSDSCARAQWTKPTAVDNCNTPSVIGNFESGACFKHGVTEVVFAATDAKNNRIYCTFTVTVKRPNIDSICATDSIRPRFTLCPQSFTVTSADSCVRVPFNTPIATDNCGVPTMTSNLTSATCFRAGTNAVVFTATDAKGNKSICSFAITVVNPCATDTIKPKFTFCPTNLTLLSGDSCARAQWATPYATDNCGTPKVVGNFTSGSCFKVGTTGIVYTATDAKGNTSICSFAITVVNPCANDTIKPRFTYCPAPFKMSTLDSCTRATWSAPVAADNCGIPSVLSNYPVGSCFKQGVTEVVYTAKDSKGNTANCSFTITVVNPCATDSIKPKFTSCPTNLVVSSLDSCAKVTWNKPLATDNCSNTTITSNFAPGACFKTGTTAVIYTATDAKGNSSLCSFTIAVKNPCTNDTIKPTFYNCPANIVKETPDTMATISWREPTAIDNCGVKTFATTTKPGSVFKLGSTTVTYSAIDAKGNTGLCSFTVTVRQVITPCTNDTIAPVFTNCPADVSVTTASTSAVAQWTKPTATDNCSTPSVSSNIAIGASFPVGTTTVNYYAKDAKNNTAYCTFKVIVTKTPLLIDSSKCYVLVARSSKKALSIAYASSAAGADAVQWTYANGAYQKWRISNADSNSVNLTVQHTGMNLETRWGALTNGSRLMQYTKSTALTQKWQLIPLSDGYFKVINKASGRAMSVSGGSSSDGTLIVQLDYRGEATQQWSIEQVACSSATGAALASNDMFEMNAQPDINRAKIEWVDNTGYKNDYYEVEKLNAKSGKFESLQILNNKSFGNEPIVKTVYDNTPTEGDNFYRVKVVYLDSLQKVSPVSKVNFNHVQQVKVFPNPANDFIDIDVSTYKNESVDVYLYNGFGQRVAYQNVQKGSTSTVHFDISEQQSGQYLIRIAAQGKRDVTKQVQIVR